MSQYRVGLLMGAQDRWSPVLSAQSRLLNRLQRQVKTLATSAGRVGLGSSVGQQAVTRAKTLVSQAREEGRLAVVRARTESQIAAVRARAGAAGVVAAERENQARVRTQAVVARTSSVQRQADARARAAENQLHTVRTRNAQSLFQRRQTHLTRLEQLRERGDRDALIGQQRLYQAQMRSYLLQQRVNRTTGSPYSSDQQHLRDRYNRVREPFEAGNRIAGGVMGIGLGMSLTKAIVGLGKDEALREYIREKTSFEQLNLDFSHPGSNKLAFGAAERVRKDVRGLDMASSIDVVKDLVNVTGHLEEAINPLLMKRFAQFKVANKVAYGQTDGMALNAVKSAELLIPNAGKMSEHEKVDAIVSKMELINKVMAGTGGRVNGNEIFNFVKTAQSSRMGLSEDGLLKLVPIMQEMTGNRTGTSLMSTMQNLANGRATVASVRNMLDMGLINTKMQTRDPKTGKMKTVDGVEYTTTGTVKRMRPGALKGDLLLRTDPVAWVEKYLIPKTKGMKTAEIDRLVNSIIGNRTAAGLVMTMITQINRIKKDFAIIKGSKGIEDTDRSQQNNYLRAEYNYHHALNTLRQKSAVVILPTLTKYLNKFGDGIEKLNDIVTKYPDHTKMTLIAGAIGGIGLAGGSALWVLTGIVAALKGLASLKHIAPAITNAAVTNTAANVAGGVAGGVASNVAAGAGTKVATQQAAQGGIRAAAGGFFRQVGAFLFGSLLADAIAKSPIAKAIGSIGAFFGRAVSGATGPITRVFVMLGATATGQAITTIGSTLVAGLGSLLGSGLLVGAALAVGAGIGTLIYKGLESSGVAERMEAWLAAHLPAWALGDAGTARTAAGQTAAAAGGQVNARYGLTGEGLIAYNRDMADRRRRGLAVITPQQYGALQRGQGPLASGVAAADVSNRVRTQRVAAGLPAVGMSDAEWQTLKNGGGPVRPNVVADELRKRAERVTDPFGSDLRDPRMQGPVELKPTFHITVPPGKMPPQQARETAERTGRMVTDKLEDFLSTGYRPTNSLPGPVR